MSDDILHRLAVWLTPASIQLTTDQLEAYSRAIVDLADGDGGEDAHFVEAAHGEISESTRSALADAVVAQDPLFVARDRDELLARLAGAVVIARLERGGADGVTIALFVQSARFAGLRPRVDELPAIADAVLEASSQTVRERNQVLRTTRKSLSPDAEMPEAVSLINSLVKQANDTFIEMHKMLALIDEEVNALWWARSEVSPSKGVRWDSMEAIDRVITAALELHDLISFQPATPAQLSLLRDVGGDAEGEISLSDLGKALRTSLLADDVGGRLMPLASAAHLWNEHADDPRTVDALIKKGGLNPKQKLPVRAVGEQILRERFLSGRK